MWREDRRGGRRAQPWCGHHVRSLLCSAACWPRLRKSSSELNLCLLHLKLPTGPLTLEPASAPSDPHTTTNQALRRHRGRLLSPVSCSLPHCTPPSSTRSQITEGCVCVCLCVSSLGRHCSQCPLCVDVDVCVSISPVRAFVCVCVLRLYS